jgi:zinc transport system permease protein
MNDLLLGWLEPAFMKRAAFALAMLAPACAALGTHVIQARLAFFSDAVAHSAFTGVAIGLALGLSPMATLIGFAVAVAAAVVIFKATGRLPPDTVIGVFMSASIALGLALVSLTRQVTAFTQYLFGNVLAISPLETAITAGLCLAVFVFLGLFGNGLALAGLSEPLARAERIRVRSLELAFALLLAVLTAVAVRFVGALLVTALLLTPAAAARQLAVTMRGNFWLAVSIGLLSAWGGLWLSYQLEIATGAAIVLVAMIFFLAGAVVGRIRKGR